MDYNTQREKLILPEYGRNIQKMVDRATQNAQLNSITNARFFQADLSAENLSKQEWAITPFNKVLLDPARAGALESIPFIISLKPSIILRLRSMMTLFCPC